MGIETVFIALLVTNFLLLCLVGAMAIKLHMMRQRLLSMNMLQSKALAQLVRLTAEMNRRNLGFAPTYGGHKGDGP